MSKPNNLIAGKQNTRDKFIPINIDVMFSRVMRDEEACKQTLEAILGFEIEKIEYVNPEQEIDAGIKSKGIRADIYAKESGKVYDIEMQNYFNPDIVKRMRYYQSAIDTSELEKGATYDMLSETFIIFICTFDMFNKGHAKYNFEVCCTNHEGVEVDFAEHFIVLNSTAYKSLEDTSLRSLLEYINDGTVKGDKLSKTLDGLVQSANKDKRWVNSMWEGLTREEIMTIDLNAWQRKAEEAQAALAAEAEARAKAEAQAQTREAEARAKETEIKLTDILLDQNRIDDLKRASKDPEFKQQLMKELKIT